MKSFSKRFASAAMAAAMVLSLAAVPTTDAQAATGATLTKKTSVQANKSYTYNLKGIKSSQYVKIYKSSGVTVKKGSTTLKNGAKLTGGKTIKLSVKASTKLTGKKYTLKAKVYNSKTKKYVKTVATKGVKVNYSTKGVTLDQTALELAPGATATLKATMTTEGTNSKIKGWNTDKPEVATVKDGVVTAVAEGTATITVMTSNGKTAACTVTVKKAAVKVESAKLIADDIIRVAFSSDAKELVDPKNVTVETEGNVPAVKSVKLYDDGMTADIQLYNVLLQGKEYDVNCGSGLETKVTAAYGKADSISILTTSAAKDEKTVIEYKLFDANGVDVTKSSNVAANCIVTINGTYSAAVKDATAPSVTMSNEGDVAEVKITFNTGAKDETDVTGEGKITCVAATAERQTEMFKTTSDLNLNSKCAKFYLGATDSNVKVAEGNTTDNIYFCAKDKTTGDVVSYDVYEAESSNDNVMNVTVDTSAGKFAVFKVTGIQKGSASINIKAVKNGAEVAYTIPVIVTDIQKAVKLNATINRTTMSNSMDDEYSAQITAELKDADNNVVPGNFVYEVTTEGDHGIEVDANGKVTARGAKARTYTIRVAGSDQKTGEAFERNVSVTVKDILKATLSGNLGYSDETASINSSLTTVPVSLTYQYEFDRTTLDTDPRDTVDDSTGVRLYAMYNGLFAGYVRGDGTEITIANEYVEANANSVLDGVYTAIKYGNKYVSNYMIDASGVATYDLTTVSTNSVPDNSISVVTSNVTKFKLAAVSAQSATVEYVTNDANKGANYGYVAKTGTYTIESRLMYRSLSGNTPCTVTNNNAYKLVTKQFEVKYGGVDPTVTVLNRNLADINVPKIRENLKTNVDMNNNTSDYESIDNNVFDIKYAYGQANKNIDNANANGLLYTVKYVMVEDQFNGITWKYYVPVNQTFKTK